MKIGVFDSGIGGLVIAKSFINKVPDYDYVYYGDTKNLPYGEKTPQQILSYTIDAIKFLISKDAKIIIIACNSATSGALRYIQRVFIPSNFPEIKVLGVVIPTLEESTKTKYKKIGIIATQATINSKIYSHELKKLSNNLKIQEIAAPALVPAIENNNFAEVANIISTYKNQFTNIDALVLGCTHYPLVKDIFREEFSGIDIISSDEFMGKKLEQYLNNHPEISTLLSKNNSIEIFASQLNDQYIAVAKTIFPNNQVKIAK